MLIQNKKIVIVISIILLSLALLYFLVHPRWTEGVKIRTSIIQYQEMIDEKEKRVRNISQDKKDFEQLSSDLEKVKSSFFSYNDAMGYVINNLTDLVKKSGVNYTSLSIRPLKLMDNNISDFSVTLEVEGKYNDMRKLIGDLESTDRAVYLDDYAVISKTVEPVTVGSVLVIHLLCMTKTDK